jgi:predicted DNA-binding transcriptional regulator AlpA
VIKIRVLRKMTSRVTEKLQDVLAYPPRLMSLGRASAYVGFGTTKFRELVDEGKMPRALDIDGSPRWDRFDLDAAVEDLKDRRRDPVVRDHDRLDGRLKQMENGKHEDQA